MRQTPQSFENMTVPLICEGGLGLSGLGYITCLFTSAAHHILSTTNALNTSSAVTTI